MWHCSAAPKNSAGCWRLSERGVLVIRCQPLSCPLNFTGATKSQLLLFNVPDFLALLLLSSSFWTKRKCFIYRDINGILNWGRRCNDRCFVEEDKMERWIFDNFAHSSSTGVSAAKWSKRDDSVRTTSFCAALSPQVCR